MWSAAIRPSSSTSHATVSIARWITHANFSHEFLVVLVSSALCAATSPCNISLVERVNLQTGYLAVERYLGQQTCHSGMYWTSTNWTRPLTFSFNATGSLKVSSVCVGHSNCLCPDCPQR